MTQLTKTSSTNKKPRLEKTNHPGILRDTVLHTYTVTYRYYNHLGESKQNMQRNFLKMADAISFKAQKRAEYKSKIRQTDKDLTLQEIIDNWITMREKEKNIRKSTLDSYRYTLKYITQSPLSTIQLHKLKPEQINEFFVSLKQQGRIQSQKDLSNTTLRYLHKTLKMIFQQAIKDSILAKNPMDSVPLPQRSKKEIHLLSLNKQTELLSIIRKTMLELPTLLALNLGLRRGEVLGLTWDNVDLENKIIKISQQLNHRQNLNAPLSPLKTNSSYRQIPLVDWLVHLLAQVKTSQEMQNTTLKFVCCKPDGSPYSPNYISKLFSKAIKKINAPYATFHDLRHTFASNALEKGVDLKTLSDILGHSDINITSNIYLHPSLSLKRTALEKANNNLFDNYHYVSQ